MASQSITIKKNTYACKDKDGEWSRLLYDRFGEAEKMSKSKGNIKTVEGRDALDELVSRLIDGE